VAQVVESLPNKHETLSTTTTTKKKKKKKGSRNRSNTLQNIPDES
jgi:hypothetical protein